MVCCSCLHDKPANEFWENRLKLSGRYSKCRTCSKIDMARRQAEKEAYFAALYRDRYLSPQQQKR